MPRKLTIDMTLDTVEDDVLFTRAGLDSDDDARALLSRTDTWLGLLDAVRAKDRAVRMAVATADAKRSVANVRLDAGCEEFGAELKFAVRSDFKEPRWKKFFALPVGKFVRQGLAAQVATVRGWLDSVNGDDVLEKHRAGLDRWSKAADAAIVATRGTSAQRGELWQARLELTEDLTRERDGLHAALVEIANQKKLPREWADGFFRTEAPDRTKPESTPAPAPIG